MIGEEIMDAPNGIEKCGKFMEASSYSEEW